MAGVWVTSDCYWDAVDAFETEDEAEATGLSYTNYERATMVDWEDWACYGSKPWEVDGAWPPPNERPVPWHPFTYWARWGPGWSVILTRAIGIHCETFDADTGQWVITEQDVAYASGAPMIGVRTPVAAARVTYPWAFPVRPLSQMERDRRAAPQVTPTPVEPVAVKPTPAEKPAMQQDVGRKPIHPPGFRRGGCTVD
jgi:hypothetical protein